MSRYKVVAIIPARGGSKGVPRKNVRVLAGKPLIAHTIEHAKEAKTVNRVIVSTDDAEIAAVSEQYGTEVCWRPKEISGDAASSEVALIHTIDYLKQKDGYVPDLIVFLQCTSPLTLPEDIDGTVQLLINEDADSALSVTPFHYFLWRQEKSGDAVGINHHKSLRLLRQAREPQFLETGAVYVMRVEGFREAEHRFFGKTVMHEVLPERCLEIDEPVDFVIAEVLMRKRQKKQAIRKLPLRIGALVLDFDGVFTDNGVIVFQDGSEAVICNRGDGLGLSQMKRCGIPVLALSTEKNSVVQARCDKIGIDCLHGIQDKKATLSKWLRQRNIDISQVIYVGNDVNDLSCLQAVGCGVAVNDAHPEIKNAAKIVLSSKGGYGAVREICDLILNWVEGGKKCLK